MATYCKCGTLTVEEQMLGIFSEDDHWWTTAMVKCVCPACGNFMYHKTGRIFTYCQNRPEDKRAVVLKGVFG